jgi:hypothetical protein
MFRLRNSHESDGYMRSYGERSNYQTFAYKWRIETKTILGGGRMGDEMHAVITSKVCENGKAKSSARFNKRRLMMAPVRDKKNEKR